MFVKIKIYLLNVEKIGLNVRINLKYIDQHKNRYIISNFKLSINVIDAKIIKLNNI